jgi:hypothetical protein
MIKNMSEPGYQCPIGADITENKCISVLQKYDSRGLLKLNIFKVHRNKI